ncbi:MAG: ABC transporter ATP-binding protein [Akkermansiaceae bacterium]
MQSDFEKRVAVRICDVSKKFGDFRAVSGVSLDLVGGEILGLLGPNGAGKTTTVKMLMGMLSASAGSLRVMGMDSFKDRVDVQKCVGYLPDEPVFQQHLRGIELLEFVGSVRGMDKVVVAERIRVLGERLGLYEDLGDFAANFSKGMRKKLAFMMALLHSPAVLIMDEPTNGLDPVATREFLDIVREQAAEGTAILYSTHLLDQAEKLCDGCVVMHEGELVARGSVQELMDESGCESLEKVFFKVTESVAMPKEIELNLI